jgi:hypothetical protein
VSGATCPRCAGPVEQRGVRAPVLGLLGLAVAGAAVAVAFTWEGGSDEAVITATGGSLTVTTPVAEIARFASWPRGRDGWTIVLASIPKGEGGRDAALARAQQARSRGLPRVGITDSGAVASLHPGYWVVFTGVYDSEPEATSQLLRARAVVRTAATRRMAT